MDYQPITLELSISGGQTSLYFMYRLANHCAQGNVVVIQPVKIYIDTSEPTTYQDERTSHVLSICYVTGILHFLSHLILTITLFLMRTIISISSMSKVRLSMLCSLLNGYGYKWNPGLNYQIQSCIHSVRELLWSKSLKKPNSFLIKTYLPGSDDEYHISTLKFMAFFPLEYLSIFAARAFISQIAVGSPRLAKIDYSPLS